MRRYDYRPRRAKNKDKRKNKMKNGRENGKQGNNALVARSNALDNNTYPYNIVR